VCPYIEDNVEARGVFATNQGEFWARLFDERDEFSTKIPLLVCDGAHRRYVCVQRNLPRMYAMFLRPTISFAEMVLFYTCNHSVCALVAHPCMLTPLCVCGRYA